MPVNPYALRRNFIQNIQKIVPPEVSAGMAGHAPRSNIQFTHYGRTYGDVDLTSLLTTSEFKDIVDENPFLNGLKTPISVKQCRLTKNEYITHVTAKVLEEKKHLDDCKKTPQSKYGNVDDYVSLLEAGDMALLKDAIRNSKNAKERYRRKAMEKKREMLHQDFIYSATLNEDNSEEDEEDIDDLDITMEITTRDEIHSAKNDNYTSTVELDGRYKMLLKLTTLPLSVR